MNSIIIQVIGAAAYILLALSYFEKKKKNILLVQVVALTIFTVHYQFLGGITGAICNFISAVTMIIIYWFDASNFKSKKILIGIIIAVTVFIAIISYEDLFSILPIIASIIMFYAFLLNNENSIRKIGLVSNLLWTIYGVVHASYFAIIFEVFAVIFTLIAIYKNQSKEEIKK